MRIDSILVVLCELIAFLVWLINYKHIREFKYKLFTVYLGIIAGIELLNLISIPLKTAWPNYLVMHFNIPLQFVFLIYFLLYKRKTRSGILSILFIVLYLVFFFSERFNLFVSPENFDSLSYGIGNLLLIISIIIALIAIFKDSNPMKYNQDTLFWIIMGLIIFYIGSFPYQNFRNFFWSEKSYYGTAYFLHYLSQGFNSIMYLLFTYAIKWKIK